MAAGTPSTDAASPLRLVATGAAYLVLLGAALQLIAHLAPNPTTSAGIGAVVVSFAATRAHVATEPFGPAARARLMRATAIVLAALAVPLAIELATSGAGVSVRAPQLAVVFGVVEPLARAYRDELWLHGIPLAFALRAKLPPSVVLPYLTLTGVAAVGHGASLTGALLTAGSGLLFVALWWRTRDAWAPVGAHFAWRFTCDTLLAGEPFELAGAKLPVEPASTGPVALAAAVALFAAAGVVLRGVIRWPTMPVEEPDSLAEVSGETEE